MVDLILRDQLAFICTKELELFLKEREPESLGHARKSADQFKEARYTDIVNLTFKGNNRSQSRSTSRSRSMSPSRGFSLRDLSKRDAHALFVETGDI